MPQKDLIISTPSNEPAKKENGLEVKNSTEGTAPFSSMRTSFALKSPRDLSKSQPNVVQLRSPEAREGGDGAVSSMRHMTINKNEIDLSSDEINRIKEGGIKICLLNSSSKVPTGGKAFTLKRRFAQV